MLKVPVPPEIEAQLEKIAAVLYDGDMEKALGEAVRLFVEHETKRLPSGEKFDHFMSKRMVVEADKEGYSEKEISSAFEKLKERKKRLESFDFKKKKEKEE